MDIGIKIFSIQIKQSSKFHFDFYSAHSLFRGVSSNFQSFGDFLAIFLLLSFNLILQLSEYAHYIISFLGRFFETWYTVQSIACFDKCYTCTLSRYTFVIVGLFSLARLVRFGHIVMIIYSLTIFFWLFYGLLRYVYLNFQSLLSICLSLPLAFSTLSLYILKVY